MIASTSLDAPLHPWSRRIVGAVLLLLTAGLALGQRDFAKLGLHLGPVWLFPLDVGLGICLLALLPALIPWLRTLWGRQRWFMLVLLYVGVGFIYLLEAFPAYGLVAIKDYAYVYYALYAVVAFLWVRTTARHQILFGVLAAGVSLAALANLRDAFLQQNPVQYRGVFAGINSYGAGHLGFYSGVVFLGAFAALVMTPRSRTTAMLWGLVALHWGNMILTQTRSVYLGLIAGTLVLLTLAPPPRARVARRWAMTLAVLLGVPFLVSVTLPETRVAGHINAAWQSLLSSAPSVTVVEAPAPIATQPETTPALQPDSTNPPAGDASRSVSDEPAPSSPLALPVPDQQPPSVVRQPTDDGRGISVEVGLGDETGQWRLQVWNRALSLLLAHPLVGQGFGRPVDLYIPAVPLDNMDFNSGLPHNTYLLSLIRQGILGTSLLATVLVVWFVGMQMWLRKLPLNRQPPALAALSVVALSLVYAVFSLFFESPHMAAVFWAVLGVGIALRVWAPHATRGSTRWLQTDC